jgi:hypothetical protein
VVNADVQQAKYFLGVFGEQHAEVAERLAHHRTELMMYEHVGDLAGVHCTRQVIRALEKEAFDIQRIVTSLWKKVAPGGAEGIEPPTAGV